MVMRHHEELRQKEEKAKRDEHAKIRRVASSIAKEVRAFWSSVEKVQTSPRTEQTKPSASAFLSDPLGDRNNLQFSQETQSCFQEGWSVMLRAVA